MTDAAEWGPAFGGATIGMPGPDGGTIARDEEHPRGARLTLETGGGRAPYVLTCAVDGWMVHLRLFSDEAEAQRAYEETRPALRELAQTLPEGGARRAGAAALPAAHQAMARFMSRYP